MRADRTTLLAVAVLLTLPACNLQIQSSAAEVAGGAAGKGRAAIDRYGCASCHTIPGISAPEAFVGPPLDHIARRVYIGGVLTNTRENMVRWIMDPPAIDPRTAMPNLNVTDQDARDIAGYLYTLR